ncbi:MAG TPA: RNA methyltransferase [Planctomycetota bacterium]|nr:RNA methyltransferase [Planctomycetota bacterium]
MNRDAPDRDASGHGASGHGASNREASGGGASSWHAHVWPQASRAQLAALEELRSGAGRRAAGACLVEGELLLAEALAAGLAPRLVAVAPGLAGHAVVEAARAAGASIVSLGQRRAERLSDREHAPGLLAAVPLPAAWDGRPPADGPALVVALCGLQDPGNVGTLLRSARAFGAAGCLALPGTADAHGPKVVRASAGASFTVPAAAVELAALPELAQRHGLTLVAAVSPRAEPSAPRAGFESSRAEPAPPGLAAVSPRAASARDVIPAPAAVATAPLAELPERCLLLLGHETRGVPELPGCATASVPQEPGVDSLNVAVAGSILMSLWYRSRRR